MNPFDLPNVFPVGTMFAVADGVPITESPDGEVLAWDSAAPRRMSGVSNAVMVSEDTFRMLVKSYLPTRTESLSI